jgi:hypothetical protein
MCWCASLQQQGVVGVVGLRPTECCTGWQLSITREAVDLLGRQYVGHPHHIDRARQTAFLPV